MQGHHPDQTTVNVNVAIDAKNQLDRIEKKLDRILAKEIAMQNEIDNLLVQATANTDAEAAMELLLTDIHDRLVAAQGDPVKVKAVADMIAANTAKMTAATVANTPAAPTP